MGAWGQLDSRAGARERGHMSGVTISHEALPLPLAFRPSLTPVVAALAVLYVGFLVILESMRSETDGGRPVLGLCVIFGVL